MSFSEADLSLRLKALESLSLGIVITSRFPLLRVGRMYDTRYTLQGTPEGCNGCDISYILPHLQKASPYLHRGT